MKAYIVLRRGRYSPHITALNGATFRTRKEAEQVAKWNKVKYEIEAKASEKFWGDKVPEFNSIETIVEITLPDSFLQD